MAKIHVEYIKNYLDVKDDKSFIGSELNTVLMEKFPTLKNTNCRKILHDAVKGNMICSSYPITFLNNQYAYFSKNKQFGYEILSNSIKEYKHNLHRVIFALQRNEGVITKLDLCKIAGVTIANDSHSASYDSLINELKILKIVDIKKNKDMELVLLKGKEYTEEISDKIHKDQVNKNTLLFLALNWLVQSNLIDQKQLCYMGELNNYNGVERNNEMWDAFGFSNAVGIGENDREFQTIVVCDFLPYHVYEEYDFTGFKERVDRIIFSTKTKYRKVLPIIISIDASPYAYSLIKKHRCLFFNIKSILGDNVLSITKKYTHNIIDIEKKILVRNSDINGEVESSLIEIRRSGNESNYGNLKGQLFEYLMYPVLDKIYGSRCIIRHSYSGSVDGKKFECDYLIQKEDECIIFELKGYAKGNIILKGEYDVNTRNYTPNSILWFLNKTFNLCSKSMGDKNNYKFCYITTAELDEEAKEELVKRHKNKPNELECFYNYDGLIALLEKYGMKKEIKVIEQFYS